MADLPPVTVWVVDGAGQPVAGALVAVESGSAPYPEFAIRADAEGRVLLKLPAGQFRIGARGPRGARGTAEVKSGDSSPEAVIRLDKAP